VIVTVASGKGGTGKTTLAVGLAQAAAQAGDRRVRLLDLDVEAPNAGLFVAPRIHDRRSSTIRVPRVDADACQHCGECVRLCRAHALADVADTLLVFDELCSGCGVCVHHCPHRAMREIDQELGELESGTAAGFAFGQGRLRIGRARATPVIRALKSWLITDAKDELTILDAPPGAACPVIEAARGSDRVLLVTEPSPFGLHDLGKAVSALRDAMHLPVGVVLNRARGDAADGAVETFCREHGLPLLLKIPFDRELAAAYAAGMPLIDARPELSTELLQLLARLQDLEAVA
jgi:MinD superfamily P-loop ATPase